MKKTILVLALCLTPISGKAQDWLGIGNLPGVHNADSLEKVRWLDSCIQANQPCSCLTRAEIQHMIDSTILKMWETIVTAQQAIAVDSAGSACAKVRIICPTAERPDSEELRK